MRESIRQAERAPDAADLARIYREYEPIFREQTRRDLEMLERGAKLGGEDLVIRYTKGIGNF